MTTTLLQQALNALSRMDLDSPYPVEPKLIAAIRAHLAAQPAPAPPFDRTTALVLLQAASKSGDPGAISLAAQLAGAAPCKDCGYVNFKCRCQPAPVPDIVNPISPAFVPDKATPDYVTTIEVLRARIATLESAAPVPAVPVPVPVPLTDEQIRDIRIKLNHASTYCHGHGFDVALARAIERAHGIAASPEKKP
jgi:predicted dienelactone hydrolase